MYLAGRLTRTRLFSAAYRYYCSSNMPSAILLLAQGAEEMEAVISVDVMRRGGIDVTVAGVEGTAPVVCSRNVVVQPDVSLEEAAKKDYDAVVLPGGLGGGGGANILASSAQVGELLKKQEGRGAIIACICAAPIALKSHGIAMGKKITSHPGKKDELVGSYNYLEDRVVIDGKLITSRGPGTAFEFALALVEALQGKDKVNEISPPMVLK